MKVSYNWLSEYINIPYTPEELVERLTMAGIEVEAVTTVGNIPQGIVVGEILERNPHPDADKLSVCRVSDGEQELQIVCGAPNCDAGAKIPLATIGTVFIDDDTGKEFPIKKCKLRGVESFGMMCSSRELGLSDEHEGLLHLDAALATGTPITDVIPTDTVYDVEITPNRPDWLSHWGVARDIAALCGAELKFPTITVPAIEDSETTDSLVTVRDYELCPRYTGRIIRGVKVAESPDWLKTRLTSIGLRPINNIVDITNFVLHELGHPLHAFDLALLDGEQIIVRRAVSEEKIVALDGKEYELNPEMLVIADAQKPVALAGIMGGEHSGVTEQTVDILLESAVFEPTNIRATARDLIISSDSSYRFERGVDYAMSQTASDRATALILELAGGQLVTEFVDVFEKRPDAPPSVVCRYDKIRKLLGVELPDQRIAEIFTRLGLTVDTSEAGHCTVTTTSYRLDLFREADLAEEVARIHGLENIPAVPIRTNLCADYADDAHIPAETACDELISLGLYECKHYSFIDEEQALLDPRFTSEDLVKTANPISLETAVMRPTLFAEMLNTVQRNVARKNIDLALFEIGKVFCANPKLYPEEHLECCVVLTGRKHPERFSDERAELYDFYDLKGILESWFRHRKIKNVSFAATDNKRFAAGRGAAVVIDGKPVGELGQLDKRFSKRIRTENPVFMALLDMDKILANKSDKLLYEPISQYPSVTRDVAFVASESLTHQDVMSFICKVQLKNLEAVELFDVFRGDAIGTGKKSMAYTLTFRNADRTLTDKEVNKSHERLRNQMAAELPIELR